jgi:hypothetical protein
MENVKLIVGAVFLVSLLASCSDGESKGVNRAVALKESAMSIDIFIKLGETGTDFAERYPDKVRVQHQPAGLDFYKVNWSRPRGMVKIDHRRNSFVVEDALSILASQDLQDLKEEGLNEFTVNSGMSVPDPGLISHDEARKRHYEILRKILDSGWKNFIDGSDPRLSGRARLNYCLNVTDSIGLDAAYIPTLDEWMRIPSHTAWKFYADGAFLELSFTRERTLTDPTKPGSYLLSFNIKTDTEFFRGYAGPENRLRWKEFVKPELAKLAPLRAKAETELRAKGIPIDETYQDPPLPAVLQR